MTATNPSRCCLPKPAAAASELPLPLQRNSISFFITLLNECVSGADSCFLLEVPVAI
jgi:hypothetical protein